MKIFRTKLLNKLEKFVLGGNGLVIGSPGVGKTYLIDDLQLKFQKKNIKSVYLPIDRLGDGSEETINYLLNTEGDLIEKLLSEGRKLGSKGVLFFDSLDSARNEEIRKNFLLIIQKAISDLSEYWNVIVVIRTYEARKSSDLLTLFPKRNLKIHNDNVINYIDARHIYINKLTNTEIGNGLKQIFHTKILLENLPIEFTEVLSTPYNINLLYCLVEEGEGINKFENDSEIFLLHKFWIKKINNSIDGDKKENILRTIIKKTIEEKTLYIRKEEIKDYIFEDCYKELISEEIIREYGLMGQYIGFSHNNLYDFGISILIFDEDPREFVLNIQQYYSDLIFLFSSLNYHFRRLWYINRQLFISNFIFLVEQKDDDYTSKLVGSLFPPKIFIQNICKSVDYDFIFSIKKEITREKIIRLSLLAFRSNEIRNTHEILKYIYDLRNYINGNTIGELANSLNVIYKNEKKLDEEDFNLFGKIIKVLFRWILENREKSGQKEWIDKIGSNLLIPLLIYTFDIDKVKSEEILFDLLSKLGVSDISVSYFYQIANHIDEVWNSSPIFTKDYYEKIFNYIENREDIVSFGGPILNLRSTVKQDFYMCKFILKEKFKKLFDVNLDLATDIAITTLDRYIKEKYIKNEPKNKLIEKEKICFIKIEDSDYEFIKDSSYFWDLDKSLNNEELELADELFIYYSKLLDNKNYPEFEKQIICILKKSYVMFFIKRILKILSCYPESLINIKWKFSFFQNIFFENELIHEYGTFIHSITTIDDPSFVNAWIKNFENFLIKKIEGNDPEDKRSEVLINVKKIISYIPLEQLFNPAIKKIKKELIDLNKENTQPLVTIRSEVREISDEVLFRERGIEVKNTSYSEILQRIKTIREFHRKIRNTNITIQELQDITPEIQTLYDIYKINDEIQFELKNLILETITETTTLILRSSIFEEWKIKNSSNLYKEIILHAAIDPEPIYDSVRDDNYSDAFWTSAPRNEASRSIIFLALYDNDCELYKIIENLINDVVPSVRYLLAIDLWRLLGKDKKFFYKLLNEFINKEKNTVVLSGLIYSIGRMLNADPDRGLSILKIFIEKHFDLNSENDIQKKIMELVLALDIYKENEWARNFITENVLVVRNNNLNLISPSVFYLLEVINPENIYKHKSIFKSVKNLIIEIITFIYKVRILHEDDDEFYKTKIFQNSVYSINIILLKLEINYKKHIDEFPQSDQVSIRLYYYSLCEEIIDAIISKDSNNDSKISYISAQAAHHFMQFAINAVSTNPPKILKQACFLIERSKQFQYISDSLALDDMVKLIDDLIINYSFEINNDESHDHLIRVLNQFANIGWPEAYQLFWRLDEIYK